MQRRFWANRLIQGVTAAPLLLQQLILLAIEEKQRYASNRS